MIAIPGASTQFKSPRHVFDYPIKYIDKNSKEVETTLPEAEKKIENLFAELKKTVIALYKKENEKDFNLATKRFWSLWGVVNQMKLGAEVLEEAREKSYRARGKSYQETAEKIYANYLKGWWYWPTFLHWTLPDYLEAIAKKFQAKSSAT